MCSISIAYAKAHRHPELAEQTIWDVFEAERPQLERPQLIPHDRTQKFFRDWCRSLDR